jgi:putative membrane protein
MKITSPYISSFSLAGLLGILALLFKNYEFLLYAITVTFVIALLFATDQYFKYSKTGLWLFNSWLVLHILGGLAYYQGIRFYDLMLLDIVGEPYQILKYDQFVHFYCYIAISILMWSVVHKIAKDNANYVVICIITILAASSLGAINEIIEFIAAITLDRSGVGGYMNTLIDLVANLLGAITGTIYMYTKNNPAKYVG